MANCPDITDAIDSQTNLWASLSTLNANFSALQDVVCKFYNTYPIGTIIFNSSSTYIPTGWIVCNGQYVNNTIYSTLATLISGVYGPVSGTWFKIPDCRARNFIQAGTGSGLTTRTLANSGGVESVTLSASQMATHTHTVTGSHTHFARSPHSHSVHDPNHIHVVDDPGHTHFVYYGISPTTTQAQYLSAGFNNTLTTTSNVPSALTPTVGQINYGAAQATSSTSVYQDQHLVGAYTLGGTNYSTVPTEFWLQNFNNGGPQLLFGATPLSYWITPVASKTTATPLQVTVSKALNIAATVSNNDISIPITSSDSFTITFTSTGTGITGAATDYVGQAHDNMLPYLGVVPIIRAI